MFVGGDGKILRNRAEIAVLAEIEMTYLVFSHTWCNKRIEETCWMFVKGWPRVVAAVGCLKVPSILEWKYGSEGNVEIRGATASYRCR